MLRLATRGGCATLLDAAALRGPDDALAILFLETDRPPIHVTRREFRASSLRCAAALHASGVGPRDLVIIAHTQGLESIYAFWGALLLGAIPSMFPTLTEKLDPGHYMRSMAELTRLSEARAVLTTDAFAPALAALAACPVYGSSGWLGRAGEDTPPVLASPPAPDAIAFLQHSSGTTGLQKGVALSHRAVLNQLASYADALALREDDVIASWLPLYHDMGLIAAFIQPLVQGIPLVLMSPFDWVAHPALLLRAIHDARASLCWLPNFAYNHMARRIRQRDSEGLDLSCMRAFINCSEPVRESSHALFCERFAANGVTRAQLGVSYAMAENTFAVTQTPPGQPARVEHIDLERLQRDGVALPVPADAPHAAAQVSCGPVIAGSALKAVGADGAALPERRVGELFVRSDCMLTGYYRRPDLQPFDTDGWYDTGDQGYIADGEVFVIGRTKDLIITAGKNVYPQDIEAAACEIDGVHAGRAVAFGVPDEREGTEVIVLVAEVDTDDPAARAEISTALRAHCVRVTEVALRYVSLVERGWLIKTSSGKTARAANRARWLAERDAGQG